LIELNFSSIIERALLINGRWWNYLDVFCIVSKAVFL